MTNANIVTIDGRPHDIRCPQTGRTVDDCCKPMVAFTATMEERERVVEWARQKVRGHRKLAIEFQDAKDEERASTHIAIETAYFGIVKEIEAGLHHSQEGRPK
jgi:hypothetical protein